MIVGTAGHIDHGKTTLVQALTGVDTDRLKEEKVRGISIELGYAYQPLPDGGVLGFVDVPGHERFIHTMLAGAAGIDFAPFPSAAFCGYSEFGAGYRRLVSVACPMACIADPFYEDNYASMLTMPACSSSASGSSVSS